MSGDEGARALYYLIWLVPLLGAFIWHARRDGASKVMSALGLWVIIIGVLVIVGLNKDRFSTTLGRIGGELNPSAGIQTAPGEISFVKRSDGHFWVNARINTHEDVFMVDTGASRVALTRRTARAAGIDVDQLAFNIPISTANGISMAARARIEQLQVGPIQARQMTVFVMDEGLDVNLLGMSFLERLESFSIDGEVLTLRG